MTGEKCRHCGAPIEYYEPEPEPDDATGWWIHVDPAPVVALGHWAAPAFGGGS